VHAASIPEKLSRCGRLALRCQSRHSPSPGLSATLSPDWGRELTLVFTAGLRRTKIDGQNLFQNQAMVSFSSRWASLSSASDFLDRQCPIGRLSA